MKGFPMEGRSPEKPQRAIEPHSQMADNSKNLSMMFITLILAIVVVDQITKVLAFHFLLPHNILDPQLMPPVVIIPHLLQFQYAENTGAAFSIFANHPNFLTALSLLIVPILIVCGWRIAREDLWTKVAFGLICGGAIGNVTDRVLRGFVVDFIDLHWKNAYHWPTFNIADTAICIGIGLFIYANLFAKQSPDTCSDPVGANR